MFNRNQPYNDLPLLLPDSSFWETVNVYKKLGDAKAALAELKGRLPVIPNPLMLINTLVLQEAKDSSTIENIFTTNDKLYKALSSSSIIDSATKEVLRYREALWNSFQQLKNTKSFSRELLIGIFKIITEKNEEIRNQQVFIGNRTEIVYTPPEPGTILEQKLENWLSIANKKNEIDPLIKLAILHYQFEAIHPFTDGNGRTGRILNVLYLCHNNLLDIPVLYLSKFILEFKTDYYRLLREVTENNKWEEWIIYMLDAIKHTSVFTLEKVNDIYNAFNSTIKSVRDKAPDIYSHELIELIFNQPYCKIALLEQNNIASRNTASKYLRKLEEIGVLASEQVGREILYKNISLFEILSKG